MSQTVSSLQTKLKPIGTALAGVVTNTYHYWRPVSTTPYLIWAEDGGNEYQADNKNAAQAITGTADYYTKSEFDVNVDAIQTAFDTLGLAWHLNSVMYEDETNLIHYSWDWEAL